MPRPLDDQVAVAEADGCAHDALLFPALGQLLVEALVLGCESGVVAVRESVQNLSSTVREPLDRVDGRCLAAHVAEDRAAGSATDARGRPFDREDAADAVQVDADVGPHDPDSAPGADSG